MFFGFALLNYRDWPEKLYQSVIQSEVKPEPSKLNMYSLWVLIGSKDYLFARVIILVLFRDTQSKSALLLIIDKLYFQYLMNWQFLWANLVVDDQIPEQKQVDMMSTE